MISHDACTFQCEGIHIGLDHHDRYVMPSSGTEG